MQKRSLNEAQLTVKQQSWVRIRLPLAHSWPVRGGRQRYKNYIKAQKINRKKGFTGSTKNSY
jgi:hypothetical protein